MKLLLIDTSYLLYRSYFAYSNLTHDNQPVGAVFGFAKGVLSLIKEYQPDELIFALDTPEPTWRHTLFSEYKAGRSETEPSMISQIPAVLEFAHSITKNCFGTPGFEADDFINTIAHNATTDQEVMVFSADKDLYQLFAFPNTSIIRTKKIGGFELYTTDDFITQYELQPLQWLDYKALVGDNSDNLAGVPGIGPKTATKILKAIGCIANLTQALNLGTFDFVELGVSHETTDFIANPKNMTIIEKVVGNMDMLKQTYKLAGLSIVPQTTLSHTGFDLTQANSLAQRYQFKSILTQIKSLSPTQDKEVELPTNRITIDDGALF
jgi:DNA polymerase I